MAKAIQLNNMAIKRPLKILFVLPTLKAGGAERVISTIATSLNKEQFKSILVVAGYKKDAVYATQDIETHFLNKPRVLKMVPSLFKLILSKKPDIVVGSISHVNRVLAALSLVFPNVKFVGREASVGSIMKTFNTTSKKRFNIKKPFFRNYHKKLDAIICQSQDMADDFSKTYKIEPTKLHIVNNPISNKLALKSLLPESSIKKIITVGRLSKEKGHERLLHILAKLELPFTYTIIGDGNEKAAIFKLAELLKLTDKIKYISYTDTVERYLANSDLFIQGSFVEGFPNALLESCAVGTPVVAFNAPGGTKEIIENSINGFLVNSSEEFLDKIHVSLSKKDWNALAIRTSVLKKFNGDSIIKKYETIFTDLINPEN